MYWPGRVRKTQVQLAQKHCTAQGMFEGLLCVSRRLVGRIGPGPREDGRKAGSESHIPPDASVVVCGTTSMHKMLTATEASQLV
jgi:hypothetical protein